MVRDMINITIDVVTSNSMSYMGFRLSYLRLDLDRSDHQGQVHAHSDIEYLGKVKDMEKYIDIKYEVIFGPSIDIFTFGVDLFRRPRLCTFRQ